MANNISIKDGSAATVVLKSTDNAGVQTPHQNVDTLTTITNAVGVTNAVLGGATSDAAVITNATGSVHQYLRGLVTLIAAKINIATVDTVTTITNPITARGSGLDFSVNLTVTNGAYTVGDVVGGLITITSAVSANGKSLLIDSVTLAGQTSAIAYELWLLNADLATANVADNGVFTLAAADVPKMLGVIPIAAIDQYQGQNAIFCASVPVGKKVKAGAATTSIYAYLKALATTSPGVTAMTLNINGRWID